MPTPREILGVLVGQVDLVGTTFKTELDVASEPSMSRVKIPGRARFLRV
jgi:hypothetical protein